MRIYQLLRAKGYAIVTVTPETTVSDAIRTLKEYNLGAVVVSSDGRRPVGIMTERDVVRWLADGVEFLSGPVSAIMTTDLVTCMEDESVQSLMSTMTERRIRHLPVVEDDGGMAGIVSIGDVVKSYISELEFERDQLEGYVSQ